MNILGIITEKRAYDLIFLMIGLYVGFIISELFTDECTGYQMCYDFYRRLGRLETWHIDHFLTDFRHSLHFGLLVLSRELFGNYKILPFVSSVCILFLSYLFTKRLTGSNRASLVTVILLMSSSIFLSYDTSVTYPSFWTLFYGLSLYLLLVKPSLSIPAYFVSIPMKFINLLFLPATIGFIWFSGISRKKLIISYLGIMFSFVVLLFVLLQFGIVEGSLVDVKFNGGKMIQGLGSWANAYRGDVISFVVLMIVIPCLFLLRKVQYAKSLLIVIFGIILTSPILNGLSSYDPSWSYRWLPLVFFSAISFGFVLYNYKKIDLSMFKKR